MMAVSSSQDPKACAASGLFAWARSKAMPSSMTTRKAIGYSQTRNQVARWRDSFIASAASASFIRCLRQGQSEEDLLEVALLGGDAEQIDVRTDQPPYYFRCLIARGGDVELAALDPGRPAAGERRFGAVERRRVDLEAEVGAQQIGDGRFADDRTLVDDRDAVADLLDLVEEMARQEHRLAQ